MTHPHTHTHHTHTHITHSQTFCSVLQCVAHHFLQCVAVCCSVLQCVAVCCSVLQLMDTTTVCMYCVHQIHTHITRSNTHTAYTHKHTNITHTRHTGLCVAVCCSVLQCVAVDRRNHWLYVLCAPNTYTQIHAHITHSQTYKHHAHTSHRVGVHRRNHWLDVLCAPNTYTRHSLKYTHT